MTGCTLASTSTTDERWSDGDDYFRFMGRWSSLVAGEFIAWLAIPEGGRWLDVGCGAGDLTAAILERAAPSGVRGIDLSPEYVDAITARFDDPRAHFDVADASDLAGEADDSYDCAASGLVINFVQQPERAVAEMSRVTKPGGCVAAYVWDYVNQPEFFLRYAWDAIAELYPEYAGLDEALRFPLCRPSSLADLWRSAELSGIETRPIEVPTVFQDFDDLWSPFLAGQGPAGTLIASLTESERVALGTLLGSRLPFHADRSIHLVARAWAVRGWTRQ